MTSAMIPQLQLLLHNPSGAGYPSHRPHGSTPLNFVTVAGTSYADMSDWLCYTDETAQIRVQTTWGRHGGTADIALTDEHGASLTYHVEPMAELILNCQPNTGNFTGSGWTPQTVFAGVTTKPQFYWTSPRSATWYCSCNDFTLYSNTAIVYKSFSGIPLDYAVVDIVNSTTSQTGLTAARAVDGGFVFPAPTYPFISLQFQTLTNAIQQLATQSSQSSQFGWFFDANKQLHFFDQFQTLANVNWLLTDKTSYGQPSPSSPGGSSTYPYLAHMTMGSQFYYEFDATQLYNDVQVLGAQITQPMNPQGPPTQVWIADGTTVNFALVEPIITEDTSATYIGVQALLLVGNIPIEVGLLSAEQGNVQTDWVFQQSTSGQWYLSSQVGAPAAGTVIMVWYSYQIPLLMQAQDLQSQQLYGRLSELVNDNQLITEAQALARAQADLVEYRHIEQRLNCYTTESVVGHINPGDIMYADLQSVPDSTNGWALGIQDYFIATDVTMTVLSSGYRQYQLTLMRVSTS